MRTSYGRVRRLQILHRKREVHNNPDCRQVEQNGNYLRQLWNFNARKTIHSDTIEFVFGLSFLFLYE
jgi:hypothetical protein